jgi:pimeloyl-ACP methyl ester carboxylesterase
VNRLKRWIAAAALLLAYSCSQPMTAHDPLSDSADTPKSRMNLQLPTMGGKQFWADWRWREGWRIQENVLTGHHRVLDPKDRRHAWGSWEACLAEFERLAPTVEHNRSRPLVMLLHGMGRSRNALSHMQEALAAQDWDVAAVSYPSTRRSIQQHVIQFESVLNHLEGYDQVSFVTHSLGGVIVRELLAPERAAVDHPNGYWRDHIEAERVVMLAPPNQGSAFAQAVKHWAAYSWIFGETGLALTPQAMATVHVPRIPMLIIAGARGSDGVFNPWLDGPNDGVVRVEETHLEGEAEHLVVDNIHTFLMNDPASVSATIRFLADGSGLVNAQVRITDD